MALSFPNRSRSFDATRRAERFWGHDSAMEASFFVTEDALKRVQPDMRFTEIGLLHAFDSNRELTTRLRPRCTHVGEKDHHDDRERMMKMAQHWLELAEKTEAEERSRDCRAVEITRPLLLRFGNVKASNIRDVAVNIRVPA
jgi:Protein of unknown function (DUF1488)